MQNWQQFVVVPFFLLFCSSQDLFEWITLLSLSLFYLVLPAPLNFIAIGFGADVLETYIKVTGIFVFD